MSCFVMNHVKLLPLVLITTLLLSCGTTKEFRIGYEVTLPPKPPVVVMDNGQHDKSKFPNSKWVKPPDVDLAKQRACWTFDDIEKISSSITEWPSWAKTVEDIVKVHNETVKQNMNKDKWYHFWRD
jgi:hypothetical protein